MEIVDKSNFSLTNENSLYIQKNENQSLFKGLLSGSLATALALPGALFAGGAIGAMVGTGLAGISRLCTLYNKANPLPTSFNFTLPLSAASIRSTLSNTLPNLNKILPDFSMIQETSSFKVSFGSENLGSMALTCLAASLLTGVTLAASRACFRNQIYHLGGE